MKNIFQLLFGIAVILIGIAAGYFILLTAWQVLGSANDSQKTIIIATIPGVLSIVGLLYTEYLKKKKELAFQNRKSKEDAYDEFTRVIFSYFYTAKYNNSKKHNEKNEDKLAEVSRKLYMYASDDVISAYADFRKNSQDADSVVLLANMEKVVLAIRRDLGNRNKKIKTFDLMRLIIQANDPALDNVNIQK